MKPITSSILLVMILAVTFSCLDDPNCLNLKNNFMGINFLTADSGKTLKLEGLVVTSPDSLIEFIPASNASKIVLPLNYLNDSTTFLFSLPDTSYQLVLGFRSQIQYISASCGVRYILSDLEVLQHTFDSVAVRNSKPGQNTSVSNLDIYL